MSTNLIFVLIHVENEKLRLYVLDKKIALNLSFDLFDQTFFHNALGAKAMICYIITCYIITYHGLVRELDLSCK